MIYVILFWKELRINDNPNTSSERSLFPSVPLSHKCPQTLSTPVDLAHPQVRSPRSIFNSLSCPSVQWSLFFFFFTLLLLSLSAFLLLASVGPVKDSVPLPPPPLLLYFHSKILPPPSCPTQPPSLPSPPFAPTAVCACSWARSGSGRGWARGVDFPGTCLMTSSTYSGLREDGLSLGFLGRHRWTFLTVATETELFVKKSKILNIWKQIL